MDCIVYGVTKSRTQQSDLHFHHEKKTNFQYNKYKLYILMIQLLWWPNTVIPLLLPVSHFSAVFGSMWIRGGTAMKVWGKETPQILTNSTASACSFPWDLEPSVSLLGIPWFENSNWELKSPTSADSWTHFAASWLYDCVCGNTPFWNILPIFLCSPDP